MFNSVVTAFIQLLIQFRLSETIRCFIEQNSSRKLLCQVALLFPVDILFNSFGKQKNKEIRAIHADNIKNINA